MATSTRYLRSSFEHRSKVAIDSPIVEEELPYKFVHYPNFYGTFFMFSEYMDSKPYFCECSLKAIENHFFLRDLESNNYWTDERISAPLSSHLFPIKICEESIKTEFERLVQFKPRLCHRCNLIPPTLRYCHEMYGGNFKQHFGWYINQTSIRLGIRGTQYIKDYAPADYINLIESVIAKQKLRNELSERNINFNSQLFNELNSIDKVISKLKRSITNKFENITREEFGFRKVGEGFVSETILTSLVEKVYTGKSILKHHRPKWLGGLELDIYLPEIKLGIEYQGQQHYFPIEVWGGEQALLDLQIRDHRKRELCSLNGIRLIEFDFTEPLEINYVKNKICP